MIVRLIILSIYFMVNNSFASKTPDYVLSRLEGAGIEYITEIKLDSIKGRIEANIMSNRPSLEFLRRVVSKVKKKTAIYLRKETLLELDSHYILDFPWLINSKIPGGGHKTMEVLIFTSDSIVIGYGEEFVGVDEKYGLLTNKISYPTTLKIKVNGRVFSPQPALDGPFGLSIKSYEIDGNQVVYKYGPFGLSKSMKTKLLARKKAGSKSPFSRSSFY